MICSSLTTLTMDNSTVEQEIADFDIKAPISVTICFEEDGFDEVPIKNEIVTDDNQQQKRQETNNSAFVPILEPKKEIQYEIFAPDFTEELNLYIQNNSTDHLPENVQDSVTNINTTKKRKTKNIQNKNQTKRGRTDICNSEDKNICNVNENDVSNNVTSEIAASAATTSFIPGRVLQNTNNNSTDTSLSDVTKLHQRDISKINTYLTKCLASVSEHMRCIMKAYDHHKQHRTPIESFKEIKYNYFNLSYKTVVTILLPEEKNIEFIHKFLNDTLQRARKMAGPYYIRTYKDFANLLYEMLMWVKQQGQTQMARNSTNLNGKSVPPTPSENSATIGPKLNKHPVQDTLNDFLTVNNLNTGKESDKVCIFSSGLTGRELSINIDDSVKSKYFRKPAQDISAGATAAQPTSDKSESESHKSKNNTIINSTAEHLAKFVAKYCSSNSEITQKPVTTPEVSDASAVTYLRHHPEVSPTTTSGLAMLNNAPTQETSFSALLQMQSMSQKPVTIPQVPNASAVTDHKQHPEVSPNTTSGLTKNILNNTPWQEPILPSMLQMPSVPPFCGVSQHMQQQQVSQRAPPPAYGQYLQQRVESTQPIFQYDPTRYLHTQIGQQQQISMQYGQTHFRQPQQTQPQRGQSQQIQVNMGQTQQMPAQYGVNVNQLQQQIPQQYNQTKQPQVGLSQQYMQQPQLQQQQQLLQQQQQQRQQLLRQQQQQQQQLLQQQLIKQQRLTERCPSMTAVLNMESTLLPQIPSLNPQNEQSKPVQLQPFQPQPTQPPIQRQPTLPQPIYQTEWHQELNAMYQAGQVRQQAQKASPRSASTDSGFISPLNFNVTTEQTMPAISEETESIIPVITHVTSLNNKASFVELGSCTVCKKSTKQMCMGCMKVYYCTYQCQSQDWMAHASFCTQQPTNNIGELQC